MNSAQRYGLLFRIEERVRRARIAVPRLTDGPRIHHVESVDFDLEGGFVLAFSDGADASDPAALGKKAALQMGMAEEGQSVLEMREAGGRIMRRRHVFVFIPRRAVPNIEVFQTQGTGRQPGKVANLIAIQVLYGPAGSSLGYFIEPVELLQARHNLVVIASDHSCAMLPRPIHHWARSRVIPDEVSAADDLLIPCSGIRQDRFESRPIGV